MNKKIRYDKKEILFIKQNANLGNKELYLRLNLFNQSNGLPERSLSAVKTKRHQLKVGNPHFQRFTQEEDDLILEWAGTMTLLQMLSKINKWHLENNRLTKRTELSLKTRGYELGINWICEFELMPINRWTEELGIVHYHFNKWIKEGVIKEKKQNGLRLISAKELEKAINKYPNRFVDTDPQIILCHFGEEILAKLTELKKQGLKKQDSPIPKKGRAIQCLKTGKIFRSVLQASHYFKVTHTTIISRARKKKVLKYYEP